MVGRRLRLSVNKLRVLVTACAVDSESSGLLVRSLNVRLTESLSKVTDLADAGHRSIQPEDHRENGL